MNKIPIIAEELSLYNCTKLKWIHNQRLILCDFFQCEDSRMQKLYALNFKLPLNSKLSTLHFIHQPPLSS